MSDIIDKAILNERHISQYTWLYEQTWEQLDLEGASKHLYIFGVSQSANLFWHRSNLASNLSGIIDNSKEFCGENAGWYLYEPEASDYEIGNFELLLQFDTRDIAVIIASTNHYEEIIDQLCHAGIKNVYSLLHMEKNWRSRHGRDKYCMSNEEFAEKCRNLPLIRNKIVFQADNLFCDHGKYITLALLEKKANIDIVWILNDSKSGLPEGVRTVCSMNPRKVLYEIATAGIFITNANIPLIPEKREGQVFIHTKHWASVTLKKFYLDASTITDDPEKVELWKTMFSRLDYILTGSSFDEASCRRGFAFRGECINVGSPRSDAMFKAENYRKLIAEKYGIPESYGIVLYAPTYRYETSKEGKHIPVARTIEIDLERIKNALAIRFNRKWTVMIRLHPSVRQHSREYVGGLNVIDASDHQDAEEILSACDVLITDYSSIMFEPAFVNKPVFLFAPDKEDYIDKEYDLLIEYDALPFSIAETNDELVSRILDFDQDEYAIRIQKFLNEYGVHEDGKASERAACFLEDLIEKSGRDC